MTSMDTDGTKNGYDINLTKAISDKVQIPVIASGGGGELEHFSDVFLNANADAALAASVFHFKKFTVKDVKLFLKQKNIEVRL